MSSSGLLWTDRFVFRKAEEKNGMRRLSVFARPANKRSLWEQNCKEVHCATVKLSVWTTGSRWPNTTEQVAWTQQSGVGLGSEWSGEGVTGPVLARPQQQVVMSSVDWCWCSGDDVIDRLFTWPFSRLASTVQRKSRILCRLANCEIPVVKETTLQSLIGFHWKATKWWMIAPELG